jgi:Second Messenger Oligonucleotide or Dinucleotide Synthetase domain
MNIISRDFAKRIDLYDVLERVCEELEPTQTQQDRAQSHYEAVGDYLARSDDSRFDEVEIAPQGSVVLGTMTRPIGRLEHDVDLLCRMKALTSYDDPAFVKKVVGDRLKSSDRYAAILEEKQRCWRLNYAGDFHLDITPSVLNKKCAQGGELVPDRKLQRWKPTNPTGYLHRFQERAALVPQMAQDSVRFEKSVASSVAPYPENKKHKGVLRRTVQLAKRHRDVYFDRRGPAIAPISVIITTLAAWSYEYCVRNRIYNTGFDLLEDVLRHMPDFIEVEEAGGRTQWYIWNETTNGENFAEKWNSSPERAVAFYRWHSVVTADVAGLADLMGLDRLQASMGSAFGERPVTAAMDGMRERVSDARNEGRLSVAPMIGIATAAAACTTPVRANTFFGRPE